MSAQVVLELQAEVERLRAKCRDDFDLIYDAKMARQNLSRELSHLRGRLTDLVRSSDLVVPGENDGIEVVASHLIEAALAGESS